MADPRFFTVAGPFTVAELARRTGTRIAGAAEQDRVLRDVAPLETADPINSAFSTIRNILTPCDRPALALRLSIPTGPRRRHLP